MEKDVEEYLFDRGCWRNIRVIKTNDTLIGLYFYVWL